MDQPDITAEDFEIPEAIFVGEDDSPFAVEFEEGQFALFVYARIEDAEVSLNIAQGLGYLDESATVKRIEPSEWASIVRSVGPCLSQVMLVFKVTEGGNCCFQIPILDFLRRVNERSEDSI